MQETIAEVRDGMSNCSAAKLYYVPRTTLNDKIAEKPPKWEKLAKSIY